MIQCARRHCRAIQHGHHDGADDVMQEHSSDALLTTAPRGLSTRRCSRRDRDQQDGYDQRPGSNWPVPRSSGATPP